MVVQACDHNQTRGCAFACKPFDFSRAHFLIPDYDMEFT